MQKYLPSVLREAQASRHSCRVTVLDNQSGDGSADFVRQEFPGAEVWEAPDNKVLCSYNDFASASTDDVLVLLNNDIELHAGWVDPIVDVFLHEKDAFFAASHGNRAMARFRRGVLVADIEYSNRGAYLEKEGFTLTAGSAAFDRKKFVELGGFDELYLPGIYEDLDLCWRGWKRGWTGHYVPTSTQYHEGRASFKKAFGEDRVEAIVFRNSILFMIKNINNPVYFICFLAWLPLRLLLACIKGKWFIFRGLSEAFERMPAAARGRKSAAEGAILSDRQVIAKVNGFYHG